MKDRKRQSCLVIGHRGASAYEPENTMRAFAAAHRLGADGVELDVFLTRDGKVVVTHNNDTGLLAGERLFVRRSTLKELKRLDFGKQEKIPTLDEVFDAFLKKFSVINVEIKSTGMGTDGIERHLFQAIRRFKCADKVLVSSFNPLNLLRFKKLMPEVRLGYLLCLEQSVLAKNQKMISLVSPHTLNLDQNLEHEEKSASFFEFPRVWLWTVNTVDRMAHFLKKGNVEAIITNYPDKLRRLVTTGR